MVCRVKLTAHRFRFARRALIGCRRTRFLLRALECRRIALAAVDAELKERDALLRVVERYLLVGTPAERPALLVSIGAGRIVHRRDLPPSTPSSESYTESKLDSHLDAGSGSEQRGQAVVEE